jgi:hypothetical protein
MDHLVGAVASVAWTGRRKFCSSAGGCRIESIVNADTTRLTSRSTSLVQDFQTLRLPAFKMR